MTSYRKEDIERMDKKTLLSKFQGLGKEIHYGESLKGDLSHVGDTLESMSLMLKELEGIERGYRTLEQKIEIHKKEIKDIFSRVFDSVKVKDGDINCDKYEPYWYVDYEIILPDETLRLTIEYHIDDYHTTDITNNDDNIDRLDGTLKKEGKRIEKTTATLLLDGICNSWGTLT